MSGAPPVPIATTRMTAEPLRLIRPDRAALPAYVDALQRGWSPDNLRGAVAAEEELAAIAADADVFLARLYDPEGAGPPFKALDGTPVPRLPGVRLWIWDGDFCGSIGFRWPREGGPRPEHGHIGYAVVPWKRRLGYATRALALVLPMARAQGLAFVELTTETANLPSQQVITANGGRIVERFSKPDAHGGGETLRWRIDL